MHSILQCNMGHVKMHGRIVARILVPVEARAREVHDRARGAGLLGRRAVPRVRGSATGPDLEAMLYLESRGIVRAG